MKKIIGVFCLLLIGCGESQIEDSKIVEKKQSYNVIEIDGCEYIEVDSGILDNRIYSLTHKGNCKNPIHKN